MFATLIAIGLAAGQAHLLNFFVFVTEANSRPRRIVVPREAVDAWLECAFYRETSDEKTYHQKSTSMTFYGPVHVAIVVSSGGKMPHSWNFHKPSTAVTHRVFFFRRLSPTPFVHRRPV